MSVTKEQVTNALSRVKGPDMDGNIIDLGLVSEIMIKDDRAYFSITIDPSRADELEPLRQAAQQVVSDIAGLEGATAVLTAEAPAGSSGGGAPSESARVQQARAQGAGGNGAAPGGGAPVIEPQGAEVAGVPGVKHIVAVASGKGGVGKSTVAVNLALAFQANGLKAGILDADIYGPSQPRLLGLAGQHPDTLEDQQTLKPLEGYGLEVMSMGFMVDESQPVIWRGPMVVSALTQMLRGVAWGDLDVLVIDMPPGTGDVQLTLAQQVPLSGAIIVSTPQDLALIDARKGLNMFKKVKVPLLGIIENMSYFLCPSCGERSEVFGNGGAAKEAEKIRVPFLGEIPLHMDIRATSDAGNPIVVDAPDGEHAKIFKDIAAKAWESVEKGGGAKKAPKLVMS